MSIAAVSWAFGQILPSPLKFVLVALADGGGSEGEVWPSLDRVCRKTCQDRKTVIAAIGRLEEMGYLLDTGRRVGRTSQVKVYKLNGMPDGTAHYVYRLDLLGTGEFYIGVRSTVSNAETDKYLGSGTWPMRMCKDKIALQKSILAEFSTRAEAEVFERTQVEAALLDPLCRNITVPNTGLLNSTKTGTVRTVETVPFFPGKSTENGTGYIKHPLKASKTTKTKTTKTLLPENWFPKDSTVSTISREFGLRVPEDVHRYVAAFRDICQAKGYQYVDFDAAFRNCVRQDWPKLKASVGSGGPSL